LRLVVIGGVAAGLSAAARARRLDSTLEIEVLEQGSDISYSACGLPYFIGGEVRRIGDLVVNTAEEFERERGVRVRTHARVTAISHPRREVSLENGERVRYDKLVIATGASVKRQSIHGADLPYVFPLQTLEDARRLREFLKQRRPKTAAVIGAGYIGLEAAEALRANGLRVGVYEASDNALHRDDEFLTEWVRKQLQRFRIQVEFGRRVDDLAALGSDVVVLAAGMRPNVELASAAGIELGRTGAIRVTDQMETNLTGVYAAGDCAEAIHRVTGRPAWIPLGTTANKMGRVAGANAAGKRERFPGIAGTLIVRVCGIGVGSSGLSAAQAKREGFSPVVARIENADRASYFRGRPTTVELVADQRSGRLLGGLVIGEEGVAGRTNVIATALTSGMTVEDFEQLDLAYAPPYSPVWDPLLIAAQQLLKLLR
jgi:NADPH-dependent 2,4-dienoyl-CoA reductase/sulfur reductase-like enzyme